MKKELDEMLNRLNQWEAENKDANLTQMEEAIDAELAGIRQQLLAQMAREGKAARVDCPNCDQPMMKNGKKTRTLRTKNGDKVTIEREQMRCHECGMTLFPPG
ncbi:YgiT-type zinc finger protein [Candidatus Leptofilum sp.]|uniref:YgiT-type zinc finger protein n=1 Tax=Candidatus Leptofilum sp. TaxID=3241576 RepID=UPI003B5C05D2